VRGFALASSHDQAVHADIADIRLPRLSMSVEHVRQYPRRAVTTARVSPVMTARQWLRGVG
jgi:hypothetical protein